MLGYSDQAIRKSWKETRRHMGISRLEIVVLLVMVVCLSSVIVPYFKNRSQLAEVGIATGYVATLYQNQIVNYYSSRYFLYSLTRAKSWPDFFRARPPRSRPELLVGYAGDEKPKISGGVLGMSYVAWNKIGAEIKRPSYYIYRVEPEPSYEGVAKAGDRFAPYYHFHAMAIGDMDGDGRYHVISRAAYADAKGTLQMAPSVISVGEYD